MLVLRITRDQAEILLAATHPQHLSKRHGQQLLEAILRNVVEKVNIPNSSLSDLIKSSFMIGNGREQDTLKCIRLAPNQLSFLFDQRWLLVFNAGF